MRMKIEGSDAGEPSARIEISHSVQRSDLPSAGDRGRVKAPSILYGNPEAFHQRASVAGKALLSRHEGIPVMGIFHLLLLGVARSPDVVMRPHHQAGSFARQKFLDRLDFRCLGLLIHRKVIKTKYHQSIGVRENSIVDQQPLPSLIDPLVIHYWMPGSFSNDILKPYDRQMEEL